MAFNSPDDGTQFPQDQATLDRAEAVLSGQSSHRWYKRLLPFLGPAFIASVAYVDPGNFATNIQAGSQFGYLLIWVVVASNLMAMVVQSLSAKLGIATGKNLAEVCRERFSRPVSFCMWIVAECVAMATDLAEFLGAALGFYLLFDINLFPATILTAFATFGILYLQRFGFRLLEAVITVMVGVIAVSYLLVTVIDDPDWKLVGENLFRPRFDGSESVLLAVGILGATVMPHVIYLHSALTQNRIVVRDEKKMRRLFQFEVIDIVIAMGIAGLVNAAMLIMAASTFWESGMTHIATIEDAHLTLEPLLGAAAATIFAVSLLASGLSSSTVGTMAGQVIMQGFVERSISIWLRRGLTMIPALVVAAIGVDPTRTLVLSQVVLSFGIPFALIPLVMFTRDKELMGPMVNKRYTTFVAWVISAIIVGLNGFLLWDYFVG